jgi:hypothetical protein
MAVQFGDPPLRIVLAQLTGVHVAIDNHAGPLRPMLL